MKKFLDDGILLVENEFGNPREKMGEAILHSVTPTTNGTCRKLLGQPPYCAQISPRILSIQHGHADRTNGKKYSTTVTYVCIDM